MNTVEAQSHVGQEVVVAGTHGRLRGTLTSVSPPRNGSKTTVTLKLQTGGTAVFPADKVHPAYRSCSRCRVRDVCLDYTSPVCPPQEGCTRSEAELDGIVIQFEEDEGER
jgi:hypothetical protein